MKRLIMIAALLTGCATPPEKIAPVQMSSAEYAPLACAELKAKRDYAAMTVTNVSKEQSKIVTQDAIGVALLGVPMGSVGGDLATSVAVEKGRLAAIEKAMVTKGC